MPALTLPFQVDLKHVHLTDEQSYQLCMSNPDLNLERDDLPTLQEKMQEYLDSGVQLSWLFNPQDQQVEIYRAGQANETLALPTLLSAEAILPGFELTVEQFTAE